MNQDKNRQVEYQELLQIASQAALSAVELIYTNRPSSFRVEQKSSVTDHVTELDLASERLITKIIASHRPQDRVIGEETQSSSDKDSATSSRVVWYVDPIDGTTNYVYNLPGYAVSIAAQIDGQTVAGVVADPTHARSYHATLGGGAFCNSHPLQPSLENPTLSSDLISTALVATGFSYSAERRARQGKVIAELLPKIRDIRRMGSAALDLCSVAALRVDAYFEVGLSTWDYAAGELIATEAGARVGSLDPEGSSSLGIIAASPQLFEPLQELLLSLGASQV
ncbi:MAG: inositol monophosphatase family protein [Microthrixaceae bacterium]